MFDLKDDCSILSLMGDKYDEPLELSFDEKNDSFSIGLQIKDLENLEPRLNKYGVDSKKLFYQLNSEQKNEKIKNIAKYLKKKKILKSTFKVGYSKTIPFKSPLSDVKFDKLFELKHRKKLVCNRSRNFRFHLTPKKHKRTNFQKKDSSQNILQSSKEKSINIISTQLKENKMEINEDQENLQEFIKQQRNKLFESLEKSYSKRIKKLSRANSFRDFNFKNANSLLDITTELLESQYEGLLKIELNEDEGNGKNYNLLLEGKAVLMIEKNSEKEEQEIDICRKTLILLFPYFYSQLLKEKSQLFVPNLIETKNEKSPSKKSTNNSHIENSKSVNYDIPKLQKNNPKPPILKCVAKRLNPYFVKGNYAKFRLTESETYEIDIEDYEPFKEYPEGYWENDTYKMKSENEEKIYIEID